MKKIIVFGGGQVGSSVAKILSDDGNDITLVDYDKDVLTACLLYTSPSPRDLSTSRMPSSA